MLRNYLKTAFRNLWREKGSTLINISGLTLGISCSLVLFLLVKHAVSFDTFHTNRDRIYRVVTQSKGNDGLNFSPGIPAVLPDAFATDFPEAEQVTFTSYRSGSLITIPQTNGELKKFDERSGVVYGQPSFFKIFNRNILIGDAEKGLDEPNEVILSKRSALKYFGKEDAIGEVLRFEDQEFKITAIMEDYPDNTDLPFDVMLSYITIKSNNERGWGSTWSDEQCYILLDEDASISQLEARMPAFVEKHLGNDNPNERTFLFQPLSEIHFEERFGNYNYNTSPRPLLIALSLIAVFLIVTACINFINLSTAEAIKRSKEVGIRKSLGGTRFQLVGQFLGETTLLTLVAVLLSLAFAQVALSFLNPFMERNLALNLGTDYYVWIFLISITVVVSLLSGLYPSFVVSGFSPALALKNLISNKNSSGYNLRRGLVVFQFFISQFFIIGTIVIIQQINFIQQRDLGFAKEAIISIPIPVRETAAGNDGTSKMRTLKNEIVALAHVEKASLNSTPPASGSVSGTGFTISGNTENYGTQLKLADGDYMDLFKLELVAGTKLIDSDTATGFVVNEKLVKIVGINDVQEILGKELRMWGRTLPVIGVVKDFNTVSLSQPIEPVAMFNRISNYENLSVKLSGADFQGTIAAIQKKWEAAYPEYIFSYEFLDEQIRSFYDGQRRISVLLTIFTSMAIFIGCLGLFGLATFMASQKTKEIGIRKILGASVESIILKFSREFVVLIALGFLLAAPVAWFLMREYLNQFAYRIELGPLIFITGIGITVLIAILTVGYKSFKAATVNPVESLRYE
ncbi:MAG: ABC transporter permease [Cyclobacteriaceae bacterium]|nr:ABC transporter permease [Cyclobacteriaceae bacterium]